MDSIPLTEPELVAHADQTAERTRAPVELARPIGVDVHEVSLARALVPAQR
ncbi:MAG: hypothetical protein R3B82_03300 [Sandaracinaceae bacterium]